MRVTAAVAAVVGGVVVVVDLMRALAAFILWCVPGFEEMGRIWNRVGEALRTSVVPRLPFAIFAMSYYVLGLLGMFGLDVTYTWTKFV